MIKKHHYPEITIIVIFFNMQREAPRTLYTLTPKYQNVSEHYYEVLVVDNGSTPPLNKEMVCSMSSNFRYISVQNSDPSPASALNMGAKKANGKILGFMVDGARMCSPGILKYARLAFKAYQNPVVSTMGFHLGPKMQQKSIQEGYNQEVEDNLLDSINWKENGYRLFEIAAFSGSSNNGWFYPMTESNCLFLKTEQFLRILGFDESFRSPGGGMLNLDFYARLMDDSAVQRVMILGEGTFHQYHGGATTGKNMNELPIELKKIKLEYYNIRGKEYQRPEFKSEYIGHIPKSMHKSMLDSVKKLINLTKKNSQKSG